MGFAAALGAISTGLSMAGTVAGAFGQKQGADAAAYAAQRRVEAGKLRAMQTDRQMREDLFESIGNIDAVRAAANTNPNSPTIMAIKQNVRGKATRAAKSAVSNINAQVEQDKASVRFYQDYGQRAMIGGLMGAAGQGIGALGGGFKSGGVLDKWMQK